uniref:O-antigen export protein n=1 Tax=Prevotella sp. GTC17260 TaxID=3236796 RepID=A0AB33JHA4_9BACT
MPDRILRSKNQRDKMLRNNILFSSILKIISLLTSLLIVPVTIGYLNNEVYGVWMTITSILYWIGTFDIGLGNGMRNYLAEAISKNDYQAGQRYITTTFVLLGGIAIFIFLLILVPMLTMDYNRMFNTDSIANTDLRDALFVAVVFTLLNFVLRNIGMIFVALQKYAINDLLNVTSNVISLIIIYLLTKTTTGNLLYVVLAYTSTSVIIYALAAIPVFKRYPNLSPKRHAFDTGIGKAIISKGLGFFFIQITSCLVIFGAANMFINQYCGPTQVTVYNVAYKFFNLLVIGYTIVLAPMWNAYTDAYIKCDWQWISTTFNRAIKIWGLSVLAGIIMLGICPIFYQLWVGNKVSVPFAISLSTLVYVCFFNLNNCATYLINGLNKINVQIITSIIFTALYIISTFLIGNKYGTEGIIFCMAVSYAAMSGIHIYQCRLIINQKAKGIWNK